MENKGTGYNYGLELTIEKLFNKHYFFLFSGSMPERIGYVRLHGRNKANWWRNPERGRPAAPVTAAEYGPLFAAVAPPAPGPSGASSDRYDYLYSEAELNEWVGKIREMSARTKKTFVFFNNCHVGQAATGAKLMRRLLEGEGLL